MLYIKGMIMHQWMHGINTWVLIENGETIEKETRKEDDNKLGQLINKSMQVNRMLKFQTLTVMTFMGFVLWRIEYVMKKSIRGKNK